MSTKEEYNVKYVEMLERSREFRDWLLIKTFEESDESCFGKFYNNIMKEYVGEPLDTTNPRLK